MFIRVNSSVSPPPRETHRFPPPGRPARRDSIDRVVRHYPRRIRQRFVLCASAGKILRRGKNRTRPGRRLSETEADPAHGRGAMARTRAGLRAGRTSRAGLNATGSNRRDPLTRSPAARRPAGTGRPVNRSMRSRAVSPVHSRRRAMCSECSPVPRSPRPWSDPVE